MNKEEKVIVPAQVHTITDEVTSSKTIKSPECGTFLTEENINSLKKMFATKDDYVAYMSCFWIIRDLIVKETNYDVESQIFPLFDAINKIISSFLQKEFCFTGVTSGYVRYNNETIDLKKIINYETKTIGFMSSTERKSKKNDEKK